MVIFFSIDILTPSFFSTNYYNKINFAMRHKQSWASRFCQTLKQYRKGI